MPDLLFDRQRAALADLWRLIEERRHGEDELTVSSAEAEQATVEKTERERKALTARQERELGEMDAAFHKEHDDLTNQQAAEEVAAQQAFVETRQRLEAEEKEQRARIGDEFREALWMAESVSEGGQKRVQQQLEAVRHQVKLAEERIDALWKEVEPLLARYDLDREDVIPTGKVAKPEAVVPPDPAVALERADRVVREMEQLSILRWTGWPVTAAAGVGVVVASTVPAAFVEVPFLGLVVWLLGGFLGGLLAGLLCRTIFRALARRGLRALGRKLIVQLSQARALGKQLLVQTEPWATAEQVALQSRYHEERRLAESKHRPQLDELNRRTRAERLALELQFQTTTQARNEQDRRALEELQRSYETDRTRCLTRQEQERGDSDAARAEGLRYLQLMHDRKARQLRERWESEGARLLALFTEMREADESWRQENKQKDEGEPVSVSGLTAGTLTVDLPHLAAGLPAEKLPPLPTHVLQQPAFLPFPRLGGLLLQAFGPGRVVAVRTLQALMLRLLTALPPGKVRFTIFDPVGLGDNFAAFMHLADHDEALVTGRIWTEPGHIEKQLADLTEHMENVIQRYLRSQFSTIEEYNARAGEVAEPYRVLVVANFPVNFTPQAARRLVSLVQSGSSCGVYALIGLDTRQAMPQGFRVEDLEQLCQNLCWRDERFLWGDSELDRYPLALAEPPAAEQVIETVQHIGALSRDANRVQVPFAFIGPSEEEIWKADSRRGVTVPLGRAGAVARLSLQLGKGTAQHVVVAGKTGSGKSTLWHALIANLALRYSPQEIELYLIDFKKGVEFKAYATYQLPHARVIAIESEREFGLSVLQRLDAELRRRGDLFRSAGVNDVAGYRDGHPDGGCPRILLIVDEFQEFFVEDDRLAQEAALLLDRLVRQGRAFGLHVLLGSQTLGGAYSLARSTIDQMAVRIALQCSEADAQLILNKDNSVARLLSRPGEAIYNDANGSLEGNEIFQIVWLPEEERERILEKVRELAARELPEIAARPPLVFEGNTPAELERNPLLTRLLEGDKEQELVVASLGKAWLGEAIAIKDPTAAVFRRQTSDNLLIVGQNDEAALALLTAALVSLALQQPSAQFVVLDGTAPHQPLAGYLKALSEGWPQAVTWVERAGLSAALAALAEEMNQRNKGGADFGPRYVLINGLQSYREFRRGDDDLGFGRRGAERTVSPLEHLQALLRDGPTVGIHLLIWCDSLVNVMRSLDRAGLRECGQRVLFQMSAADSSHLLDAPLASRLGRNRALYYTDETGQPEKFRPYGLPSSAWLADVKRHGAASPLS